MKAIKKKERNTKMQGFKIGSNRITTSLIIRFVFITSNAPVRIGNIRGILYIRTEADW